MKLRLTFSKNGHAQHASHLDVLRAFTRSFARAKLPLAYSEGFNPHALLSFALPLPVSVTSECEIVDCQLTEPVNLKTFTTSLNAHLPNGLEILHSEDAISKLPKISRAEYILNIQTTADCKSADCKSSAIPIDSIEKTITLPEILVDKKSKSGTKEINIIKHLHEFEVLCYNDTSIQIRLICDAGSEFNLKPELIIYGLASLIPEFNPTDIEIHRKQLYS